MCLILLIIYSNVSGLLLLNNYFGKSLFDLPWHMINLTLVLDGYMYINFDSEARVKSKVIRFIAKLPNME